MTQLRPKTRTARLPSSLPPYDRDLVIYRLEEAGATLLALPPNG